MEIEGKARLARGGAEHNPGASRTPGRRLA